MNWPGNSATWPRRAGSTLTEARAATAIPDNWGYTYNDQNRLASVSLNTVEQASYLYNFAGQQVLRTVWDAGSAVRTVSVHDLNGARLGEYDGDTGDLLREYIWLGDMPLAVVEGGQLYSLHLDQIDRPVMATDSAGTVVWQASYTPFGGIDQVSVNTGALSAQDLRFPGQWFQAETGLYQNWMRDYDPTTGRYLQADPLGLVNGPSVYGYARMSPMMYADPTGQCPACWGAGVAYAAGAGIVISLLLELAENGGSLACVDWFNVGLGGASRRIWWRLSSRSKERIRKSDSIEELVVCVSKVQR